MQSGFIKNLQIQKEKNGPFEIVTSIELEAGKGIVGDCHFGGKKQIALISSKAKKWIISQEHEGLCLLRFKENIEIEGIDYSILNVGDMLKTDDTVIEISAFGKTCFSECSRIKNKLPCELKTGVGFAQVVKGGRVQNGDRIWVPYKHKNIQNAQEQYGKI